MHGLKQWPYCWEASRVCPLGIPTVMKIFQDLWHYMYPERIGFINGLDIFHNEDTSWFDFWEPKEQTLGHVISYVCCIVNDNFQWWCIWSVHIGSPNFIQKIIITAISTVELIGIKIMLIPWVFRRKVSPRPLPCQTWIQYLWLSLCLLSRMELSKYKQ